MRRHRALIGGLLLALLGLATSASAERVTVRDKLGRMVTLRVPVQRAVLYETYELLPVTGAWDRVAGLSRYARDNDLLQAVNPDAVRAIPSVGSAMDMNAEALLRLQPDVVVTWTSDARAVRFLEARGVPVLAVYPESLAELYDVMRLQGTLFGATPKVEAVIQQMDALFAAVGAATASRSGASRKTALWLYGKPTTVAGRLNLVQDLFARMGLDNAAGALSSRNIEVSLEQILRWNPAVLFIWGSARYGAAELVANTQWRAVRAVHDRAVFKAPTWSSWSPRLAPVALWMAASAYPDAFAGTDVPERIDRFSREVYGIPYAKGSQIAH